MPLEDRFMEACQSGILKEVQTILDELKAKNIDINFQDANQKTGTHYAVENNHDSVVDFLLKNQADVNIPDINGNSVLHIAAIKGSIRMTKILLEHGASKDLKNNAGKTPYQVAIENTCLSGHELEFIDNQSTHAKYSEFGCDSCEKISSDPRYHCSICPFPHGHDECLACFQLKEKSEVEVANLIEHYASASSIAQEMNFDHFDQEMPPSAMVEEIQSDASNIQSSADAGPSTLNSNLSNKHSKKNKKKCLIM